MVNVSEAKALIAAHAKPLSTIRLSMSLAGGLVLGENITAPCSIPAYPQSSMDGYAFAFESMQDGMRVTGEMSAGSHEQLVLPNGEAVRIFTGAAVPAGANTVLMQEKARIQDGLLYVDDEKLVYGANVRPVGSEIEEGALALPAGAVLTPAAIGFLAGMGIAEVPVIPRPRISIIVTGNELQTPGHALAYGQVYEANSFALVAVLQSLHMPPAAIHRSPDDLNALVGLLEKALEESDVVLMTGGVSVGDYDFTVAAARQCGVEKIFHKIRQKPGKPILFGTKGSKLLFGLPGNPASVLTCFYEYVTLALSNLSHLPLTPVTKQVPLAAAIRKPAGLTHFLKGIYDGNVVKVLQGQESYKLNSFAMANCLVVVPENTTELTGGEIVDIHCLAS